MLSFELSATPILNYSIWNWQTTIQNSKLKTPNYHRQQFKTQNSKFKIALRATIQNSKFKTQKSYCYGKENSDDHSGCGDGWR